MWQTRRANALYNGIRTFLLQFGAGAPPAELVAPISAISDGLVVALGLSTLASAENPSEPVALPRGYDIRRNKLQEMGLTLRGVHLSPSVVDPLPQIKTLQQFAADIRDGWFAEVAHQIGEKNEWFTVMIKAQGIRK